MLSPSVIRHRSQDFTPRGIVCVTPATPMRTDVNIGETHARCFPSTLAGRRLRAFQAQQRGHTLTELELPRLLAPGLPSVGRHDDQQPYIHIHNGGRTDDYRRRLTVRGLLVGKVAFLDDHSACLRPAVREVVSSEGARSPRLTLVTTSPRRAVSKFRACCLP